MKWNLIIITLYYFKTKFKSSPTENENTNKEKKYSVFILLPIVKKKKKKKDFFTDFDEIVNKITQKFWKMSFHPFIIKGDPVL